MKFGLVGAELLDEDE